VDYEDEYERNVETVGDVPDGLRDLIGEYRNRWVITACGEREWTEAYHLAFEDRSDFEWSDIQCLDHNRDITIAQTGRWDTDRSDGLTIHYFG
jgi:hypothetical protein